MFCALVSLKLQFYGYIFIYWSPFHREFCTEPIFFTQHELLHEERLHSVLVSANSVLYALCYMCFSHVTGVSVMLCISYVTCVLCNMCINYVTWVLVVV